jgi:hypothetical protein
VPLHGHSGNVLILDQLVERRDVAVQDLAQPRPLIGRVMSNNSIDTSQATSERPGLGAVAACI